MNLQLALILLGVATFTGIVLLSLWQRRGPSGEWLERSLSGFQSILQRIPWGNIAAGLRPKKLVQRVRQKEPSLVSSGDLDLAGDNRASELQAEPLVGGLPPEKESTKRAVGTAQTLP
ncbi:MAG: hypothetical protein VX411_05745, partial [Pseudomonadota bacterium]|nr:hypothetical protein [Pseudomonadota bacterium]